MRRPQTSRGSRSTKYTGAHDYEEDDDDDLLMTGQHEKIDMFKKISK